MNSVTRNLINQYHQHLAGLNGVKNIEEQFTVTPSVAQSLAEKMGEQVHFMERINTIGVEEMTGQPLLLGSSGTIAGRTDTSGTNERQTRDTSSLTGRDYTLKQTDFDTHVMYNTLDSWAKFPDFASRVANQRALQIARDRMMIGWNGTSAATNTDRAANPLLQDVNIGWVEKLRTEKSTSVLSDLKMGSASGNDYANLDALCYDATSTVLPEWYQNDTSLVVLANRQLVKSKRLAILSALGDKATEHNAFSSFFAEETAGGMPVHIVPFIPQRSIIITSYDNLSVYYQDAKMRMHVEDVPKRNRVEYYQSSNEAYVIEDVDKMVVIEDIKLHDGTNWA